MIILQQINYIIPMTSSYNLRHRTKQFSPNSKKQLSKSQNICEKATPRTECKIIDHKELQQKISKKVASNSASTSGSTAELLTHHALNNQSYIAQPTSNSQLDSAVNLRKNKLQEIVVGRAEDNVESAVIEQSALNKSFMSQRVIKRYQSSIQIGSDKKQFKVTKHPVPIGIPYRKFQTQLEQKVVSILNKVSQQKNCIKQIQKLFSKISNISGRDLRNKYFVSGIATLMKIITLPSSSQLYQPQLVQKVLQSYKLLQQKILYQLDDTQEFFEIQTPTYQRVDNVKLVRKIYKILKRKYNDQNRCTLQNKSIGIVQQYSEPSGINIKLLSQSLMEL